MMMRATRGAMQCMSRAAHRRRMAHCLELLKSRLRPPAESERHNPHAVHCKLWETGASQGVREQATTDFQIQYIMTNVFPGQEPGPEGERDRLRTCLYYPVKSCTYRK